MTAYIFLNIVEMLRSSNYLKFIITKITDFKLEWNSNKLFKHFQTIKEILSFLK